MPSRSDDGERTQNSCESIADDEHKSAKRKKSEEKVKKKRRKKDVKEETPTEKTNGERPKKKRSKENKDQVTNDQPTGKADAEKGKPRSVKKKLPKWQCYSVIIVVVLTIIIVGVILGIFMKPGKKNDMRRSNHKKTSKAKANGPNRMNRPDRKKNSSSSTSMTTTTMATTTVGTTTPGYPSMPSDPWNYYEYMPSGACPPPYKTIKDLKEYYDAKDTLINYCQNDHVRYQLPVISGEMKNDGNDSRIIQTLERKKIKHLIVDDASYGCRIVVVATHYRTYEGAKKFCKVFNYELVMFDTQVEKCIVTRQIIEDLKDQDIWKNRPKFMYVAGEQAFLDKERNLQFRGSTEKLLTGPLQFCKTPNQLREEVFSTSTLLQTLHNRNLAIKMDDQQPDFGCLLPVDKSEQYPFMCKRCGKRKDCRYVCEPGYNYKGFDCL